MFALLLLALVGCSSTPAATPAQEKPESESTKEISESAEAEPSVEAQPTSCVEIDPHPVAEGIADEFEVEYQQVLGWFCQGSTFDDILLALQTSELTDETPENLLAMAEEMTWDQIWDELGLTSLNQDN
ncbi:MAG: hypothetical protein ACLFWD_05640 [Anaerolineales bacterium]